MILYLVSNQQLSKAWSGSPAPSEHSRKRELTSVSSKVREIDLTRRIMDNVIQARPEGCTGRIHFVST